MQLLIRTLLVPSILFTLAATQSLAQENEVSVNFTCIAIDVNIRDLSFISGSKTQKLSIYQDIRSERVTYKGPPHLKFFRETTAPSPPANVEGEAPVNVVGSVNFPKATGDFLLVFFRVNGSEERYQIAAIQDDSSRFKPGMYRFINTAPFDIAIKIGQTKEIIPKKNFKDISAPAESNTYQETTMFSLIKGEEPYRCFKGSLFYDDEIRLIYILSPKTRGRLGRINFSVVPDAPNS